MQIFDVEIPSYDVKFLYFSQDTPGLSFGVLAAGVSLSHVFTDRKRHCVPLLHFILYFMDCLGLRSGMPLINEY